MSEIPSPSAGAPRGAGASTGEAPRGPAQDERLAFIDGLRGVAALSVTVQHVYDAVRGPAQLVPEPLHGALLLGGHGVIIFFVLSGFVISHSVRRDTVTPGFLGRFALRRSIRLDPPYWLAIGVYYVASLAAGSAVYANVDAGVVLANMVYLDQLLGVQSIVTVGWTLCIEVQFYLVYVVLLGGAQALGRRLGAGLAGPAWLAVFAIPVAVSLAWQLGLWPNPPGVPKIFLEPWCYFFAGALTRAVVAGEQGPAPLYVVWAALGAVAFTGESEAPVGLATSVAIFVVGRRRAFGRFTLGAALQYLGKLSYSLYLLHPLVGNRPVRRVVARLGDAMTGWHALALFVGAVGASIAVAHVYWWAIERPALAWARRVSLR